MPVFSDLVNSIHSRSSKSIRCPIKSHLCDVQHRYQIRKSNAGGKTDKNIKLFYCSAHVSVTLFSLGRTPGFLVENYNHKCQCLFAGFGDFGKRKESYMKGKKCRKAPRKKTEARSGSGRDFFFRNVAWEPRNKSMKGDEGDIASASFKNDREM